MKTYISAIILVLFLFACGEKTNNNNNNKIFTYNQPVPVTSLDPVQARNMSNIWAVDHLFNGLVQLDDKLNVVPCLAKSWAVSEDGLTYTFNLRDDIYFQDNEVFPEGRGRKVLAEDVRYSLERLMDPNTNSPGTWIFKNRVQEKNGFLALNDTLFAIRLVEPFRPLLGILSMQYCSVVPFEAINKYGKDFGRNPVGTGPFTFVNWQDGQSLMLKKNKDYFEKRNGAQLPYMDAVRVNFMGDRNTAYLEFSKGDLDFISGLESSFVNDLLTKEGKLQEKHKEKVDFYKAPFLNMEYLGINMGFEKNSPLRHKKVRQALNYAVDRNKMLTTLRNNVGQAANAGFIPRGLPSHDPTKVKGYTYSLEKAQKLLAEAGFPQGKGLEPIKLMTDKDYKDICTFLARQWEDIGLQVEVELLQTAVLREQMTKGNAPFFRASWIADYPDGENFLTLFYSKNSAPPNYTRFGNVKYDELYEKALNEQDDAKRYLLYQEMDRILIEEAPVIFLFYDETARFSKKGINGYVNNAINLLYLKGLNF